MTRRERLERKVEKRREWADKRDDRSEAAFDAAHRIVDGIPLGQPILVGHHSEKRHRRDIDRAHSNMSKGVEHGKMADHHRSKAAGLEDQLGRSIFSDDPDAVEELEARIAELEAACERNTVVNKAYRKARKKFGSEGDTLNHLVGVGEMTAEEAVAAARLFALCPYHKVPHPTYENSNMRNRIGAARKRIAAIRARACATEKAEAAGGIVIEVAPNTYRPEEAYAKVTFAEKPDRSVLNDLKAAGFSWGNGSWTGYEARIPESVRALVTA